MRADPPRTAPPWAPNLLLILALLLALLSLGLGAAPLATGDGVDWALIRDSRLPRTLAAIIAGAALSVAGTILQMLVRNRFVEPMTAGTGQGAAAGILAVSLIFPAAPVAAKMAGAALAALAASAAYLALVRRLPVTQPVLVPLTGLVFGGVIGAAVTFVAYQGDLLQYAEIWLAGDFSGVMRGRYELLWIAAAVAAAAYLVADRFAIAGLGRDASLSLGLNYRATMALGLLAIAVVAALCVVTVGMIPFVGLVVPNAISRRLGDNLRRSLPATALAGAALVLASDMLGRVLRHPFEIPVGTVMGVLGAAAVLWLLYAEPGNGR